jgi:polyhydroxybutyrate depolymerase
MRFALAGVLALFLACGDDASPSPFVAGNGDGGSEGGGDGGPGDPTPGCGATGAATGYQQNQSVMAGGQTRRYQLFVPAAHDGTKTFPLVFVFHGDGGSGADMRDYLPAEAASNDGGIFVYPDGPAGWDLDSKAPANDDIAFFDAMVAKLSQSHCVDKQRIFATGYSRGGYFANQLGCRRGSVLRGVVSHAGGGPYGSNDEYDGNGDLVCPEPAVASLVLHGTSDGAVALTEGQSSRNHWRRVNGCSSSNAPQAPSPCVAYGSCTKPVLYCEIPGLGHTIWSQGASATWAFIASF